MTIVPKKKSDSRSNKSNVVPKQQQQQQQQQQKQQQQQQDEHHHQDEHPRDQEHHCRSSPHQQHCSTSSRAPDDVEDVDYSGYNSGDEHTQDRQPSYMQWTEQEFLDKEIQFEKKINKKGWVIRKMAEDGACLFRAVADQIYGDQDMHSVLRKLCIDYIAKNSDYFSQYVTEDFGDYLRRKSLDHSHGNHIEIQAMSEMFNRPIEVYHYSSEPINIFQGTKSDNEPIRLSYHRSVHYNSIVNPFKATVGVGLGLPAYDPGTADRTLLEKAIRMSDEDAIEKAMLEDKLLATDWEATNEAIEEQVARESYLEWLRENENRLHKKFKKSSSPQPTTAAAAANCSKQLHHQQQQQQQHHLHHQQTSPSSYRSCYAGDDNIAGCSTSSTVDAAASCSTKRDYFTYSDTYGEAGTSSSSPKRSSTSSSSSGDTSRRSPRAGSSRDNS